MKDLHDAGRVTLLLAFLLLGLALFLTALCLWIVVEPDPDGTTAMLLQVAMGVGVDVGVVAGGLAAIEHVVSASARRQDEERRRREADDAYRVRTSLLVDLLDSIGALYAPEADRVVFDVLGSLERWDHQEHGSAEHARIQQVSDHLKWLAERGLSPALGKAHSAAARKVRTVRRDLIGADQPVAGTYLKRLHRALHDDGRRALADASDLTTAVLEHAMWVPRHDPGTVTAIKRAVGVAHAAQVEGRSALLAFDEEARLYDPDSPYADPSQPFPQRDHHLDKLHGILARAVELSDAFAELTAALVSVRELFGDLADPPGAEQSLGALRERLELGPDLERVRYPTPWETSG